MGRGNINSHKTGSNIVHSTEQKWKNRYFNTYFFIPPCDRWFQGSVSKQAFVTKFPFFVANSQNIFFNLVIAKRKILLRIWPKNGNCSRNVVWKQTPYTLTNAFSEYLFYYPLFSFLHRFAVQKRTPDFQLPLRLIPGPFYWLIQPPFLRE